MENYLKPRETTAFYEQRAYYAIIRRFQNDEVSARKQRSVALGELRKLNSYILIERAIRWVEENGTFPDRQRCLCPIFYFAKNPEKMRVILHRAHAEDFRAQVEQSRRHLISERELEERRANQGTRAAVRKFVKEFPTAPERRRAMIWIFNLHREVFGILTLDQPEARAICISLIVSGIEALETVQDQQSLAG